MEAASAHLCFTFFSIHTNRLSELGIRNEYSNDWDRTRAKLEVECTFGCCRLLVTPSRAGTNPRFGGQWSEQEVFFSVFLSDINKIEVCFLF